MTRRGNRLGVAPASVDQPGRGSERHPFPTAFTAAEHRQRRFRGSAMFAGLLTLAGTQAADAGEWSWWWPARAGPSSTLSEQAPQPSLEPRLDAYRVSVIAAGTIVGVIGANYLTGGFLTPVLTLGAVGAPADAAAMFANPTVVLIFVATEAAGVASDFVIAAAAPTAAVSVGAPLDAALRDGYTTPGDLLRALAESVSRAGTVAVAVGSYIGSAVDGFLRRPF